ncbi:tail assembly protein [Labrys sp. 22185]|uniref:tail assembly protein n=1 Tax=Labrys sp. 22185 TaxID=3453888 RepID=UPI003F8794C2
MRDVVLHGRLGSTYGRRFTLDVVSLADAMRALGAQLPGFRKTVHDGNFRVIVRRAGKDILHLGEDEIGMNLPKGDLHVVPVVQGAKKGAGIGKIIAGLLIAAVAWWNPAGAFSAGGMLANAGMTSGHAMITGLGIAAGGLAQVLSPTQKAGKDEKKSDSFTLDGVMNTGEQGVAVPLIYGEIMVSDPTPISAGMSTTKIPNGSTKSSGSSGSIGFGWTNA